MNSVLEIRGVAVEAGGRRLMTGVDLTLSKGELIGLSGPSGCGKSSLLRAIAELEDPSAGEILLQGARPCDIGWPAFRRRVVLMEQRPVLFDASVADNLARPFRYRSATNSFPEEKARTLLGRLGIERDRWSQNARSLSVGQQQRVCLVRALLLSPDALLLDEPVSALDAESAEAVESLLHEEADSQGRAALLVSHERSLIHRICDRVVDARSFLAPEWNGGPAAKQETPDAS
jgi:putative ABC transport system ATP-binding protein